MDTNGHNKSFSNTPQIPGVTNPAFTNDEDIINVSQNRNARIESKDGEEGVEMGVVMNVDDGGGTGRGTSACVCNSVSMEVGDKESKQEKLAILKNLIVISLAFVCLFTSYNSVINLQSSLNKDLGTAALIATYAAMIVSCCLLPSWTQRVLGEKRTLILASLSYIGYMVAQFYPSIATLVPTAALVGIGAAPLWSAKSTYVTKVAERYAQLTGQNSEVIITRFFGIFFLFFQSTNIWGNIITTTVLSMGVEENESEDPSLSTCGYDFCISGTNTNSTSRPSDEGRQITSQQYIIFSVFLGCGLASCIFLIFVDPLSKFVKGDNVGDGKSYRELIVATFTHMRHPYQLLLLPITIWSGLEQQFFTSDYTAAYVTCSLGVHKLGSVVIAYGVSDSLSCLALTSLMKKLGRIPGFVLAFLINLVLILVFVFWAPRPQHFVWFFVFAALWGMADAVWQAQINALYSVIFPGDATPAAFSNYRLWESVGMVIAYASSTALCVNDKITILFVVLVLGMLGYGAVEIMEKKGGPVKDTQGRIVPIDKLITRCT